MLNPIHISTAAQPLQGFTVYPIIYFLLHFNSNFTLGYNVTILAYGQTGSGKTHSMGTNFVDENEEEKGIIPRAIQNIFNEVQKKAEEAKFSIKASFIEVFLKSIYQSY